MSTLTLFSPSGVVPKAPPLRLAVKRTEVADGRILVFASDASDLVVNDTNNARDICSLSNSLLP